MNRFQVSMLLCLVAIGTPLLAGDAKDVAFEKKLIGEITETTGELAKETRLCEDRDEGCSLRRLSRVRHELGDLVANAEALRTELLEKQKSEDDPDVAEQLAKRAADLQRGIRGTRDLLAAKTPNPDAIDEEQRQIAAEKSVAGDISTLSAKIIEETKLCQQHDDRCSRSSLSRQRFELRDRIADAESMRADLLKKEGKAKDPDKAEALSKRAADLLRALNTASDITFDAQGTQLAGDELVETVKSLGKTLDGLKAKTPAPSKDELHRAEADLATAEQKLRDQAIADRESITKLEKKIVSGTLETEQYESAREKKELLENRVEATEKLITLPSTNKPLFRVYEDDSDDWWIHEFYAGMEFDSVSGILSKGFARIGYSASVKVRGEDIPESTTGWRTGYGQYYEFNALLTSSAEQSLQSGFDPDAKVTDPCKPGFTGSDPCVRKALEVEQKVFWPIERLVRHNRVRPYFGPVLALGARFIDPKKSDGSDTANADKDESARAGYRYYFGTHFGFARDAYSEVLYGRTSTLSSRRIEVRGEIPVAHWGTDSRLLLGWTANFAAGHKRHVEAGVTPQPERDVFRVFLVYNVDFLKLPFGLKAPKSE